MRIKKKNLKNTNNKIQIYNLINYIRICDYIKYKYNLYYKKKI